MTQLQMKEGKVYVKDGENLILCADQKHAEEIIWKVGNGVQGIYPIPDLQWEVKESWGPYHENTFPEKVAILKESTPSTEQGGWERRYSPADLEDGRVAIGNVVAEFVPSTEQESQEVVRLRAAHSAGVNRIPFDEWIKRFEEMYGPITRKP